MKKIFLLLILLSQLFYTTKALENPDFSFWKRFDDEILINNLVESYQNNLDLKIANSKIKESEKIVKLSLSQELPSISFEGLLGRTFASSNLERGGNNFAINNYKLTRFLLPLSASWELDIWGKNRLKTKAQKQNLKMVEQDKNATLILLESTVATNYYNLIKIDKLIELEQELYNLNKNLLTLLIKKEKTGLANKNDILEIKEILIQNEQKIDNLKTKREILENQTGYLLGDKLLSEIKRKSFSEVKLIENIPLELNSGVILNRPDVISAKENIIRADYSAKAAKREFLPSFTITGTLGFNGYNTLSKLFSANTGLADLWVIPSFDIFDGNRKYNFLKLKKLELDRSYLEYDKAVLTSIEEVNNSLVLLKNENKNYRLSSNILEIHNEKTKLELANKEFGLANEIDYILYQSAQILAQEKYVSDKINYIISMVNLYKTIGGVDFIDNL